MQEAEKAFEAGLEAWKEGNEAAAEVHFQRADALGSMKAGRYLGVLALKRAAERGDITSKLILGTLCEYGYALPASEEEAKAWYESAIRDDHENREGFMLAAGAELGMGRILSLQGQAAEAGEYLTRAAKGGEPQIAARARKWIR